MFKLFSLKSKFLFPLVLCAVLSQSKTAHCLDFFEAGKNKENVGVISGPSDAADYIFGYLAHLTKVSPQTFENKFDSSLNQPTFRATIHYIYRVDSGEDRFLDTGDSSGLQVFIGKCEKRQRELKSLFEEGKSRPELNMNPVRDLFDVLFSILKALRNPYLPAETYGSLMGALDAVLVQLGVQEREMAREKGRLLSQDFQNSAVVSRPSRALH